MTTSVIERSSATRAATPGRLLPTLVVLFFLSGMCGLIYQVLWLRLLSLVFGVTVYAASTVLASFMAGLALGSFLAGRYVDRAKRPLLWYGVAEILVGCSALATSPALDALGRAYASLYPSLSDSIGLLTLARFALSFAVLLVPTTLMGATLPIIIKSSLLRSEGLGERVSILYGTNTAGAIAGTLLAGLVLIGGLGIRISFLLAAALNLAVGIAAVLVSRAQERPEMTVASAQRRPAAPTPPDTAVSEGARRLVLVVFALSGFTSLALEVIWFRILALFLDASTYAFTGMLAMVLAGIALGSYLATPLLRRRGDWLALVAVLEVAIAVLAALSLTTLGAAQAALAESSLSPVARALVISFLVIFPATLLMGVAFPLGLRLWAGEDDASGQAGSRIGLFYSLNVFGAILGSAAGGFLLLPQIGSQGSLLAVSLLCLLSGILLLMALPAARRRLALGVGGVGLALFCGIAVTMPDLFSLVSAERSGENILWRAEGTQTTVSIQEQPGGTRVMYLDGHHQANDSPGMIYVHSEIGHLPLALHPDPREALVIGLGGGVTAGAVSRHAGVTVDVVELSQTVVQGADFFQHVNFEVLRAPNVTLRVDDGRNHLLLTSKRYDVITADIIPPHHAGAGNLYSVEYFRLARRALKDDGILLQWIDNSAETRYKLIMRTFLSVFPEATLWSNGSLMVGTRGPLRLSRAAFERKRSDPATRQALEFVRLATFDELLARYTAGPDDMRRFVGPGPILSDDRPRIEYFLSLPRHEGAARTAKMRGDVQRYVTP